MKDLDYSLIIKSLYQTILNRNPDSSGLQHYTSRIQNTENLHEALKDILEDMLYSNEFKNSSYNSNRATFHRDKTLIPNKNKFGKIALLGTCTTETLNDHAQEQGRDVDHYLMGSSLNDIVPEILDPNIDAIIVHLTFRHFLWDAVKSPKGDVLHVRNDLAFVENYNEYLNEIKTLVEQKINNITNGLSVNKPIFFLSFVESPSTAQGLFSKNREKSFYRLIRDVNDFIEDLLENKSNAFYLEINDLIRYYGDADILDSYKMHLSHSGLIISAKTKLLYQSIFDRLDEMLNILKGSSSIKMIITDLDNTLWKGIAAEYDQIISHELTEGWPLGYVEALLEFKRRGGLLAVSSKNEHKDTVNRFDKIWQGKITIDDFCSLKINWNRKSENIKEILAETNLLPENVLFIDDNPREIEDVSQAFPTMHMLTGEQDKWRNIILYSPQTQTLKISNESSNRTELIKAKVQRDNLEKNVDRLTFLTSLELKTSFNIIRNTKDPLFSRAFELVNKTNQFNTTGRRWSEIEIQDEIFNKNGALYTASVKDKFSDNGLVTVAIVSNDIIQQFVMSCRVFSLGIETSLLSYIMENESIFKALYHDTGKNKASASFYPNHKFKFINNSYKASEAPKNPSWIKVA